MNNNCVNRINMVKCKEEEDINIEKDWVYYKNGIDLLSYTCKTQKKYNKRLYIINIVLFLYSVGITGLYFCFSLC